MNRALLEREMAQLPLVQYAFLTTRELVFSDRVRRICRHECPMFNTTWACPPAVGTPDECRARLNAFEHVLVLVTADDAGDPAGLPYAQASLALHTQITEQVLALVKRQCGQTYTLAAQACRRCDKCTWPHSPCRDPQHMFPCVESHCILVTALAERLGIPFQGDVGWITWYSLIFYR